MIMNKNNFHNVYVGRRLLHLFVLHQRRLLSESISLYDSFELLNRFDPSRVASFKGRFIGFSGVYAVERDDFMIFSGSKYLGEILPGFWNEFAQIQTDVFHEVHGEKSIHTHYFNFRGIDYFTSIFDGHPKLGTAKKLEIRVTVAGRYKPN